MFLQMLTAAHEVNHPKFFGNHASLADPNAFAAFLAPLKKIEWVVYAKHPFAGPEPVLRYLSRYTQRVATTSAPHTSP
jgi:putative transposase